MPGSLLCSEVSYVNSYESHIQESTIWVCDRTLEIAIWPLLWMILGDFIYVAWEGLYIY